VNRSETERGGACPEVAGSPEQSWHVLWTRSNCEQLVLRQLHGKGFETFLPLIKTWRTLAGARHRVDAPMFPGYLFVRGIGDKRRHVEVRKARGLVSVLGQAWNRPALVPEDEVSAIAKLASADVDVFPTPFLREGERVRVVFGPLAGIEGVLIRSNPRSGLLVLSIALLQRSVATELHCSSVAPA
jgi:transcription antitermination factor NusG